jgi:hypothetical protein
MSDPWDDDAPLVDRLRWHARNDYLSTPVVDALKEAADEIERLQALTLDMADAFGTAGYGKVSLFPEVLPMQARHLRGEDFEGWGGTIGPTDDDPCPCREENPDSDCVCCDPICVTRPVAEFLAEGSDQ